VSPLRNILRQDMVIYVFFASVILYNLSKNLSFYFSPALSMLFGLICFIAVPGYYIAKILNTKVALNPIYYCLVLGIAFQISCIAINSVFSGTLLFDLGNLMLFTSAVSIIVLKIFAFKIGVFLDFEHIKADVSASSRNPIFYIFIFTFIFRFLFSLNNTNSFLPDGSLYLDTARTLVS